MPIAEDHEQALHDAIAALQSRRAMLGDAVINAALAPMLERLAVLSVQAELVESSRRLRQVSVLFLDIVGST